MPKYGPIKQKDLVKFLKRSGFEGPFSGGKHPFMVKEDITLTIPNPHQTDIGLELLIRILRQAGITKEQWENL
jgi:predicted RNA binding protein YcfA (HicA-like mRNA interferase family)